VIKPLHKKQEEPELDEYALEAEDKSRLQRLLEWIFHRKRAWPRNILTLGTAILAFVTWSRILAALFILMVALRVIGRMYLTVTGTKTFRKLFKARRLHLTTEGWWFVLFTVAIGTAAINTGVNLLYLILSMMLSFIVISGILSEITFRKLEITRSLPYSVFAGEQFDVTLHVKNKKRLFPTLSLFVEDSPGSGPELARMKACYILKAPAQQRHSMNYSARIWRRGSFTFNGFRLHSGYPFNFFNKHMRVPGISSALVYPRLYQLNYSEILSGGERADALRRLNLRVQGEEDFRGLKEFREGDNPRHIHWVSSARHRRLMVKEFEKQRANRVMVILDTYLPVGSPEKLEALEHGVSTAASLLTFFNSKNYQTSLVAYTPRLVRAKADSGRHHYFSLMEILARLDPSARGLDEMVDRLDARELRDSMVFVVTLNESRRNDEAMRVLSFYSPVVKCICVTNDSFSRYVSPPEEWAQPTGDKADGKAVMAK
jgi:uncharacterized protein (DUF58 family)